MSWVCFVVGGLFLKQAACCKKSSRPKAATQNTAAFFRHFIIFKYFYISKMSHLQLCTWQPVLSRCHCLLKCQRTREAFITAGKLSEQKTFGIVKSCDASVTGAALRALLKTIYKVSHCVSHPPSVQSFSPCATFSLITRIRENTADRIAGLSTHQDLQEATGW